MKTLLMACLLTAAAAGTAAAGIDAVFFNNPLEEGGTLSVNVEGWLPTPCWELTSVVAYRVGNELVGILTTKDLSDGAGCFQVIVPFETGFGFADLAAGDYTLRVKENRIHDPALEPIVLEFPIHVNGTVPAGDSTWDALKARYR